MRNLRRLALAAAIAAPLAVAPATISAQSPAPIVGTWNIEWEVGRTKTNGGASPVMGKGTMKVVIDGDSLLATFTTTSRSDGQPITRPSFTIGGRRTATGATFVQVSEATLSNSSDERKQLAVSTWTVMVQGDQLSGQVTREIEGLGISMSPSPLKGTRAN